MKKILRVSLLCISVLVALSQTSCQREAKVQKLRFVSWNIEHLAEKNGEGCVPRQEEDYTRLRDFAQTLEGDIISLQEVESEKAVARVFPKSEWNIVISDRPHSPSYECRGNGQTSTQQRVALAIRKGIAFETPGNFKELALDRTGLRYGVVARLTGSPDTIDVMAVHLKSGCFVPDYSTSEKKACEVLEQQVPLLDQWGEDRIENKQSFVIMGDFNNRLTNEGNKFWEVLTEMDGDSIHLKNSMQKLTGCHPRYPLPIDHILMDPLLSKYLVEGSQKVHYYPSTSTEMTEDEMLSDHCPISMVLDFRKDKG